MLDHQASGIVIGPCFRAKPTEQTIINRPGSISAEISGRSSNTRTSIEQYLSVAKENSKGNTESDDELNSATDALISVNRFMAIVMNSINEVIGVATDVGEEDHGNETAVVEVVAEDNILNTRRD